MAIPIQEEVIDSQSAESSREEARYTVRGPTGQVLLSSEPELPSLYDLNLFEDLDSINDVAVLRDKLKEAKFWFTFNSGISNEITERAAHFERLYLAHLEAREEIIQRLNDAEAIGARAAEEIDRLQNSLTEMGADRDRLIGEKFYLEQFVDESKKVAGHSNADEVAASAASRENLAKYKIEQLEREKTDIKMSLDRVSLSLAQTKVKFAQILEEKEIMTRVINHYASHIESCSPHLLIHAENVNRLLVGEKEGEDDASTEKGKIPLAMSSSGDHTTQKGLSSPFGNIGKLGKLREYLGNIGGYTGSNVKRRLSTGRASVSKSETSLGTSMEHALETKCSTKSTVVSGKRPATSSTQKSKGGAYPRLLAKLALPLTPTTGSPKSNQSPRKRSPKSRVSAGGEDLSRRHSAATMSDGGVEVTRREYLDTDITAAVTVDAESPANHTTCQSVDEDQEEDDGSRKPARRVSNALIHNSAPSTGRTDSPYELASDITSNQTTDTYRSSVRRQSCEMNTSIKAYPSRDVECERAKLSSGMKTVSMEVAKPHGEIGSEPTAAEDNNAVGKRKSAPCIVSGEAPCIVSGEAPCGVSGNDRISAEDEMDVNTKKGGGGIDTAGSVATDCGEEDHPDELKCTRRKSPATPINVSGAIRSFFWPMNKKLEGLHNRRPRNSVDGK